MIDTITHLNQSNYPKLWDLQKAANWSKVMAIALFVLGGFLAIMAFFGGAFLANIPGMDEIGMPLPNFGVFFLIFYLPLAFIYIFMGYKLWSFAVLASKGVKNDNPEEWMSSFAPLKTYFLVTGIVVLLGLGIMVLAMIITFMSGLFMNSF